MKIESTVSTKGQVTIPARYREELHLEPQDKVRFRREGDTLVLEPVRKKDLLALYQTVSAPDETQDPDEIRKQAEEAVGRQAAQEGQ